MKRDTWTALGLAVVMGAVATGCAQSSDDGEQAEERVTTTRGAFTVEGVRQASGRYRATVRTNESGALAELSSETSNELSIGGARVSTDGPLAGVNDRVLRAWMEDVSARDHVGYESACYFGDFDYVGIRDGSSSRGGCFWATDCVSNSVAFMSTSCMVW